MTAKSDLHHLRRKSIRSYAAPRPQLFAFPLSGLIVEIILRPRCLSCSLIEPLPTFQPTSNSERAGASRRRAQQAQRAIEEQKAAEKATQDLQIQRTRTNIAERHETNLIKVSTKREYELLRENDRLPRERNERNHQVQYLNDSGARLQQDQEDLRKAAEARIDSGNRNAASEIRTLKRREEELRRQNPRVRQERNESICTVKSLNDSQAKLERENDCLRQKTAIWHDVEDQVRIGKLEDEISKLQNFRHSGQRCGIHDMEHYASGMQEQINGLRGLVNNLQKENEACKVELAAAQRCQTELIAAAKLLVGAIRPDVAVLLDTSRSWSSVSGERFLVPLGVEALPERASARQVGLLRNQRVFPTLRAGLRKRLFS
ncbi:hypothetical protein IWZ03DRAFT_363617 [Phyllosticta citriasiana]|uniref:Uncharacterized protein n=1 Tax=Phyllosticta citriasiana TaxID=595635 RepID=A0ABR1KB80_9PEZI